MVGIPWIWMGVGWTIPFFFSPFRMAAKTIRVKSGPLGWSCEWGAACKIGEMDLTLRKLHLSKALNGWWNAFTFNKNMVLLPYTFVPCWRHAENVTWRIPAEENIRNYLVLSLMQTHMIWQINGEWKSAHLVFIGSSYVIPLAISFTDIRADKDIERCRFMMILFTNTFKNLANDSVLAYLCLQPHFPEFFLPLSTASPLQTPFELELLMWELTINKNYGRKKQRPLKKINIGLYFFFPFETILYYKYNLSENIFKK